MDKGWSKSLLGRVLPVSEIRGISAFIEADIEQVAAFALLLASCRPGPELDCLRPLLVWLVVATAFLGVLCVSIEWRSRRTAKRDAASLGGIPIPRVKGRWPLNVDIVVKWAKWTQDEVGRMLVELERQNGKTYNTRMLLEDQIVSSDPAVLRHVFLHSDDFIKGEPCGAR